MESLWGFLNFEATPDPLFCERSSSSSWQHEDDPSIHSDRRSDSQRLCCLHTEKGGTEESAREIRKTVIDKLSFCVTLLFANCKAFLMNRKLEMLELDDNDVVVDMRGGNGGGGMMGMGGGGMSMAAIGMGGVGGVNYSSHPQQQHHHNALDLMDSAAHEVSVCVIKMLALQLLLSLWIP